MNRIAQLVVVLALGTLSGCASLAVTVASIAGGLGVNHFTGSVQTRTFTDSMPQVRRAALIALHRMKAEIEPQDPNANSDQIRARLTGREIQIDFEALSASTTRIRALTRIEGGVILDGATATEIVAQTERALGEPRHFVVAPANPLAAALPMAAVIPPPGVTTRAIPQKSQPAARSTPQLSNSGAARTAPLAK